MRRISRTSATHLVAQRASESTTAKSERGWLRTWFGRATGWGRWVVAWLFEDYARELFYVAFVVIAGLVRRSGTTIVSGSSGLKFTFGRARKVCEPGFHPLLPLLQTIQVVPTRARTLDLPAQKLTTLDGLVYRVDASLVYRVVDVRKALIEVDDLQKGMLQMLGLGVNEVLRNLDRSRLRVSDALDVALAANLSRRVEPWGVVVERAAFTTIDPTRETTRITQLDSLMRSRTQALELFAARGVTPRIDLALLGSHKRFVRRTHILRRQALATRRLRRWKRLETSLKSELAAVSISPTERALLLRTARERFELQPLG